MILYPSRFSWIIDPFCKPGMRQDGPPNIRISRKIHKQMGHEKKEWGYLEVFIYNIKYMSQYIYILYNYISLYIYLMGIHWPANINTGPTVHFGPGSDRHARMDRWLLAAFLICDHPIFSGEMGKGGCV
jgi:hypothetical protein